MRRTSLQHAFFLVLLLLVTVAFIGLIREFFFSLFWAAVLTILFRPVYHRCSAALGHRASLSALATLVLIVVIVILPLFFVGLAVTHEAVALYDRIESGAIDLQQPLRLIERTLPVVSSYLTQFGIDVQKLEQGVSNAAVVTSQFLASQALNVGQNTLRFSVLFVLMLYLLFFFLRDGAALVEAFIRTLPLGEERERRLFAKFAEVARATMKGTFVVGLVQGTLGGLLFWGLGIDAPVFWGVLMMLLSFLPALGAGIIWLPAAIVLFATGEIVRGIILLGAGVLVIGLVDNFLRPLLVGRDTLMPDYLILLSTLGGLGLFGVSGFVIGPIIAALFLVVWEIFAQEYGSDAPGKPGREEASATATQPPPAELDSTGAFPEQAIQHRG